MLGNMRTNNFLAQSVSHIMLPCQSFFRLHETHDQVIFRVPPQSRNSGFY
jgi:hypothetical protein